MSCLFRRYRLPFEVQVDYYNATAGRWEPLLERFVAQGDREIVKRATRGPEACAAGGGVGQSGVEETEDGEICSVVRLSCSEEDVKVGPRDRCTLWFRVALIWKIGFVWGFAAARCSCAMALDDMHVLFLARPSLVLRPLNSCLQSNGAPSRPKLSTHPFRLWYCSLYFIFRTFFPLEHDFFVRCRKQKRELFFSMF